MKIQFYVFCLSQFWTLIYLLLFGHCVLQYLKEKIGVVSSYLLVLSTLILFVFGCVAACSAFAKLLKSELDKRSGKMPWLEVLIFWVVINVVMILAILINSKL